MRLAHSRPALVRTADTSAARQSHSGPVHTIMALVLSAVVGFFSIAAAASDQAFTGVFEGTGRACSGEMQVRAKTIAWHSTFSTCTATRYDVLERNADPSQERIVFRLKKRSSECRYPVIEAVRTSEYNWNVTGYPSLEGFQKKHLPDWSISALHDRQVLSCPMTKSK